MSDGIIKFVRRRDYQYIRELGAGGFGKTVLLLDDVIDQHFVCKKYAPSDSALTEPLFDNFMNEIKLMHRVFHQNVARIFGYHAQPSQFAGYIIMEYVEGETIGKHVAAAPDSLGSVFRQILEAFCHLEECGVLHRDIRPENILVRSDGVVKVIDLGFGKAVESNDDFNKSITLNWPFAPPREFANGTYDFRTEVYFVGKLFERIMHDNGIVDADLVSVVRRMCQDEPRHRFSAFAEVCQTAPNI
jgi:eukaryotic-like serine/threonine-protein kinase